MGTYLYLSVRPMQSASIIAPGSVNAPCVVPATMVCYWIFS
jgi:hypothetical protein